MLQIDSFYNFFRPDEEMEDQLNHLFGIAEDDIYSDEVDDDYPPEHL